MAGDYTRFTFGPTSGLFGGLQTAGPRRSRRRFQRADRNRRPALAVRDDRHHRSLHRPQYDTGRVPGHPRPRWAILTSASAGCTSMEFRWRTTDSPVRIPSRSRRAARYHANSVQRSAVSARRHCRRRLRRRRTRPIWCTSTCGNARSPYLEDPSLREIALGGPDTTTRIQSVWQVRVLQNVGEHGCGDDIPLGVEPACRPSAGRLTTSAVLRPASDDPCIISPSGGYRGLENRLYRVEIHSDRPHRRRRARQVQVVTQQRHDRVHGLRPFPRTEIIVQQIGRDQVLRFRDRRLDRDHRRLPRVPRTGGSHGANHDHRRGQSRPDLQPGHPRRDQLQCRRSAAPHPGTPLGPVTERRCQRTPGRGRGSHRHRRRDSRHFSLDPAGGNFKSRRLLGLRCPDRGRVRRDPAERAASRHSPSLLPTGLHPLGRRPCKAPPSPTAATTGLRNAIAAAAR